MRDEIFIQFYYEIIIDINSKSSLNEGNDYAFVDGIRDQQNFGVKKSMLKLRHFNISPHIFTK